MKMSFKAVFFVLSLNVATLIIGAAGLNPAWEPQTPMNATQSINATNVEGLINIGDTSGSVFYDLTAALWGLWTVARTAVIGFPDIVAAFGAPMILVTGVYTLFTAAWAVLIFEIRMGRDITDD